jgi:hypothetical protein
MSQRLTANLLSNILKNQSMLSWLGPAAQSKYGQGLMNCKAVFSAAALVAAAYAVTLGASWSETIAIPSQVDGGKGSDVPATVNEAGFDRRATSDHPEGGADSLALGGSSFRIRWRREAAAKRATMLQPPWDPSPIPSRRH